MSNFDFLPFGTVRGLDLLTSGYPRFRSCLGVSYGFRGVKELADRFTLLVFFADAGRDFFDIFFVEKETSLKMHVCNFIIFFLVSLFASTDSDGTMTVTDDNYNDYNSYDEQYGRRPFYLNQ